MLNQERQEMLLALIVDSYKRMATNRDEGYRNQQKFKVRNWLEELTLIYEKDLAYWSNPRSEEKLQQVYEAWK